MKMHEKKTLLNCDQCQCNFSAVGLEKTCLLSREEICCTAFLSNNMCSIQPSIPWPPSTIFILLGKLIGKFNELPLNVSCFGLLKVWRRGPKFCRWLTNEAQAQSLLSQGTQNPGVWKFLHSRKSNERFRPKFLAEIIAAFQAHQVLGKTMANSRRTSQNQRLGSVSKEALALATIQLGCETFYSKHLKANCAASHYN